MPYIPLSDLQEINTAASKVRCIASAHVEAALKAGECLQERDIRKELDVLRADRDQLLKVHDEDRHAISRLEGELDGARRVLDQVRNDRNAIAVTLDSALAKTRTQLARAESELSTCRPRVAGLEATVNRLVAERDEARANANRLAKSFDNEVEVNARLHIEVDKLRGQLHDAEHFDKHDIAERLAEGEHTRRSLCAIRNALGAAAKDTETSVEAILRLQKALESYNRDWSEVASALHCNGFEGVIQKAKDTVAELEKLRNHPVPAFCNAEALAAANRARDYWKAQADRANAMLYKVHDALHDTNQGVSK